MHVSHAENRAAGEVFNHTRNLVEAAWNMHGAPCCDELWTVVQLSEDLGYALETGEFPDYESLHSRIAEFKSASKKLAELSALDWTSLAIHQGAFLLDLVSSQPISDLTRQAFRGQSAVGMAKVALAEADLLIKESDNYTAVLYPDELQAQAKLILEWEYVVKHNYPGSRWVVAFEGIKAHMKALLDYYGLAVTL